MIDWWNTTVGDTEIAGVTEAIRGRHLSQGPITEALERRIAAQLEVPHVVLTTSGSAALLLALMACEVGPGDEVVVPNRTFMATANAGLLLGARVKLVDVERDRPVIEPAEIERVLTQRTKVILPVHRGGRAADMPRIRAVARQHGLRVVEDAAQAFCSRSGEDRLGTLGDIGAFSLGVTKLITTGQGGFCVTRDAGLAERLRQCRNHGAVELAPDRYDRFGFNFKFTDMQAAIGLKQMDRLADKIERHRAVYAFYRDALREQPAVRLIPVDTQAGELPLWTEALVAERRETIARLAKRAIRARPLLPSLSQAAYLACDRPFPNSVLFARHAVVLPCGPNQPEENLQATVTALKQITKDMPALPESGRIDRA